MTGYLLVVGIFGAASALLDLCRNDGPLYRALTGSWYGSTGTWALIDEARYLCSVATGVLALLAGLVLWRRPTAWLAAVTLVCGVMLAETILSLSSTTHEWAVDPPSTFVCIGVALVWTAEVAIPTCVVWAAWRSRCRPTRSMVVVAWTLVIYGACGSFWYCLLFLDPGEHGYACNVDWGMDWKWALWYITRPLLPLICLGAGVGLILGRARRIPAAAFALVCATSAVAVPEIVCWYGGTVALQGGPGAETVQLFVDGLCAPAVALWFFIFVLRYKAAIDPSNPVCPQCGYSLRGLPSHGHRCPECGRQFAVGDAKEG
ncbi:MAG: hypothetical protein PVJ57_03130 [Phycisphaerae bacterium]